MPIVCFVDTISPDFKVTPDNPEYTVKYAPWLIITVCPAPWIPNTVVTLPSKTALALAPALVCISIPLFSISTLVATACRCLPN